MTGILFFAIVVLGIVAVAQGQRLRDLGRRLDRLERAPSPPSETRAVPTPRPAAPVRTRAADAAPPARAQPPVAAPLPSPVPTPAPAPPPAPRPGLESLIGARLPVWIGAIALVVAGFFLVRYSIEVGLLGPGVRTLIAALFAALLIAASEAARRLPATAADPRIAQALAGAGIASAYGTLYIAAALYHLITPLSAFVLMLGVTALGLVLALRHGPPTAVLALTGGFVAPLVAGFDAAGVGPLLAYLALFTAALFGLAIHRGWAWLAVAATVAGFGWVNFLLFALGAADLAAPAAFIVLLAIAASIALPRAGITSPLLRLAPLVGGLVQLLAFAPALDFSALAWSFYLTLAAATLILAWRDERYLPGALAALALALVLLAAGLAMPESGASAPAAIAMTLLFAASGIALLSRGPLWGGLAVGGLAGPVLLTNLVAPDLLATWQWAAIELIAAALAAWISWQRRSHVNAHDPGLVGGALAAAVLATAALGQLAGADWIALPLAVVALALGAWAARTDDADLFRLPTLAFAAMLIAAVQPLAEYLNLIGQSITGTRLTLPLLPPLAEALRHILPAIVVAALLLTRPRQFGRARTVVGAIAAALAALLLYHLLKLPLAITDSARFTQWGFVERAAITQLLFAAGWLIHRRTRFAALGMALSGLAVFRFVWLDLLVFNPVFLAQSVGNIPLLNIATLHAVLTAFWCTRLTPPHIWRGVGMAATLIAVAVAVRQAAQGDILLGPIGTGENYGYSAAFLLLALGWLAFGIRSGARDLRLAGLALLTVVTLKVFLIDAAALDGLLRILSFLGLGIALIGIGWVYNRFLTARPKASVADG